MYLSCVKFLHTFLQSLCGNDNISMYDRALYTLTVSEELTVVGIIDELIQLPYANLELLYFKTLVLKG